MAATGCHAPPRRSRWTRWSRRSRARSRRWSASSTTTPSGCSAHTSPMRVTAARPSCCGRGYRTGSSDRCRPRRWPSSSSSRAAPSASRRWSPKRNDRKLEMAELEIRNLHVRAGDKEILRGLELTVDKGEIDALMGPNGSGKSTLANAIMGHPGFEVTDGQIIFNGQDITVAAPDERARMGLFMAFQYPVSVPGVTVTKYLRTVMNAHRDARGEGPIPLKEFRQTVEAAMKLTKVPRDFSSRYLNEGFSGGEKKRMEILQLALQHPALAILDETDSGLDIDALRVVAAGVNAVAGPDMGVVVITHYQRIVHLVEPSHVHVMYQGRIVKQGGPDLVTELEAKGYGWIVEEVGAAA